MLEVPRPGGARGWAICLDAYRQQRSPHRAIRLHHGGSVQVRPIQSRPLPHIHDGSRRNTDAVLPRRLETRTSLGPGALLADNAGESPEAGLAEKTQIAKTRRARDWRSPDYDEDRGDDGIEEAFEMRATSGIFRWRADAKRASRRMLSS